MQNPDIMVVTTDDRTAMSPRAALVFPFMPREQAKIEVTFDDTDDYRTFGPFLHLDAVMYAVHAEREADPVAWLTAMDRKCNPAAYPNNDWTGLLAGVTR